MMMPRYTDLVSHRLIVLYLIISLVPLAQMEACKAAIEFDPGIGCVATHASSVHSHLEPLAASKGGDSVPE